MKKQPKYISPPEKRPRTWRNLKEFEPNKTARISSGHPGQKKKRGWDRWRSKSASPWGQTKKSIGIRIAQRDNPALQRRGAIRPRNAPARARKKRTSITREINRNVTASCKGHAKRKGKKANQFDILEERQGDICENAIGCSNRMRGEGIQIIPNLTKS